MRNSVDMTEEREIIQWLLDSEPVGTSLGWPINLEGLVQAVRRIVTGSRSKPGNPREVAAAWKSLCVAIGPALTEAIVESGDWWCLTPPPELTVPFGVAVWECGDRRVVGRRVVSNKQFVDYEFVVI